MAQANQVFERIVRVLDVATLSPVTGLTAAAFTFTLEKGTGAGSFAAAGEAVTVLEIGTGLYWVRFTPTTPGAVYRLTYVPVDPDAHIFEPEEGFQDQIDSFAASSGPYLTTRLNVRRAFELRSTDAGDVYGGDHKADPAIDDLLPSVTDYVRSCYEIDIGVNVRTWVTESPGVGATQLVLPHRGATLSVTSVHDSTELPRVFDATTLMTADEDYVVDPEAGIIHRMDGLTWTHTPRSIQVVYQEGVATIPAALERAAIEVIGIKLSKGQGRLYHLLAEDRGDGEIAGVVRNDIPPHAREIFELYRGGHRIT